VSFVTVSFPVFGVIGVAGLGCSYCWLAAGDPGVVVGSVDWVAEEEELANGVEGALFDPT
jgi:hypothetical protein